VVVDVESVRAFAGGEATGPSPPVDHSRNGTKHSMMVHRRGVPLAIRTAGANTSDHRQIVLLVLDLPKIAGRPVRPKELPHDLFADRGYDEEATQDLLRWLGSSLTSLGGTGRIAVGWGRFAGWSSGRSASRRA
jgi:hypothetical protein